MPFDIVTEDNSCVRDSTKLCNCWVRLANGKVCSLNTEVLSAPDMVRQRARDALQMYHSEEEGWVRELVAVAEEVARG